MKQVFLSGSGEIKVVETPPPALVDGSIMVRTRCSVISSGTEGAAVTRHGGVLGLYEKVLASRHRLDDLRAMIRSEGLARTVETVRTKLGELTPVGYSGAGFVAEVADPSLPFRPGDPVACMGTGWANHAEINVVPRNLAARVPDGVPLDQAAFAALGCIAMQGIRRLELTPGERVGVLGLGLIGQIAVRMLAAMGYRAYGTDIQPERVERARRVEQVQAWVLGEQASSSVVKELTGGVGLDGVIVCAATESDEPVNLAFDLCRPGGRVSVVGDVGLGLDRSKMYAKELELRMSRSYGPGRFDPAYELRGEDYSPALVRWSEGRNLEHFLWLLQARRLDLSELISARYSAGDASAAYAHLKSGDPGVLGVLLEYEPPNPERALSVVEVTGSRAVRVARSGDGPVRLGVIGAGSYMKGVHLPNLARLRREFEVHGIASRSGATAVAAAKRFGVPRACSDYRVLLDDQSIEAVVIATRHASHARIALDALEAGKHVFVEKPMATTVEDCESIVQTAARAGRIVRVGFNRRFAPHLRALRDAVGHEGSRILLVRVNIGPLVDHWSNTPEEGGRLLGEGVHFYDLANWFLGGEPTSICSAFAGPASETNPNATVMLEFANGSQATVVYTTLGHRRMGKELYEAFGRGVSARMSDFSDLDVWGGRGRLKIPSGDKGQRECLREFAAAIRGGCGDSDGADARAGLAATRIALEAIRRTSAGNHACPVERRGEGD